ncbi:MAG: thioredoxin domain-containing protein [Longimicrobiales bacterium]|nr:thioredoxin domain-containing protein [Longimicrobiales bacterium]
MTHHPFPRTATRPGVLLLALLWGCGESRDAPSAGATADPVAADLLSSARSPGLGLDARVPLADPQRDPSRAAGAAGAPAQELDIAQLGFNSGTEGAPVRVLEFSDFGCHYCRQFHIESFPALEAEYMATGKVEWKYVPIVIGLFPNAMEAARAGECAGEQGRFPEMRDLLFDRQRDWKNSSRPEPVLEALAREVGLDVARYNSCVSEGRRDERILAGTRFSREVGVRGTPTFFVVGYAPIPGAIPLDLFRQVLDTVHAERTREAGGA